MRISDWSSDVCSSDLFVTTTLVCSTKTPLLFFTSRGIAHALKAYALPEAAPNAKGRPLVNYVNLREGEMITAVLAMPEVADELQGMSLVFVTDRSAERRVGKECVSTGSSRWSQYQ